MSRQIPLTRGRHAIVDDADYEWLSQWKWTLLTTMPTVGKHEYSYAARQHPCGKLVLMHRAILRAPESKCVDHMNGNRLDNRRSNLRLASHSENMANRKKHKNNTSGYMGVWQRKSSGNWRVELRFENKRHCGGTYATPEEAARAYDELARRIHGEFATLNFPKDE